MSLPTSETMVSAQGALAYRILVVDDDRMNTKILTFLLEQEGYTVTTAGSATTALGHLRQNEYDLIMLDIVMPEMNGIELCRQIRQRQTTPIIFLSGLSEVTEKVTG